MLPLLKEVEAYSYDLFRTHPAFEEGERPCLWLPDLLGVGAAAAAACYRRLLLLLPATAAAGGSIAVCSLAACSLASQRAAPPPPMSPIAAGRTVLGSDSDAMQRPRLELTICCALASHARPAGRTVLGNDSDVMQRVDDAVTRFTWTDIGSEDYSPEYFAV